MSGEYRWFDAEKNVCGTRVAFDLYRELLAAGSPRMTDAEWEALEPVDWQAQSGPLETRNPTTPVERTDGEVPPGAIVTSRERPCAVCGTTSGIHTQEKCRGW